MTNEEKLEQLKKQVAEINGQIEDCEKELAKEKEHNERKTFDEMLKDRDIDEDEKTMLHGNKIFSEVKVEKSSLTGRYRVIHKGSVIAVCDHPYKAGMVASAIEVFVKTPAHVLAALSHVFGNERIKI